MGNTNQFWDDKTVLEFVEFTLNTSPIFQGRNKDLEDFKKSKEVKKEPLFTTNDGKQIFEGDTYWTMDKENLHYWYAGAASKIFESGKNSFQLYFSTKDAAKEYLLLNKPCLSLKDIYSIDYGNTKPNKVVVVDHSKLKELVKQKLNQ